MKFVFILLALLPAAPCRAYIAPIFALYLGLGGGGERYKDLQRKIGEPSTVAWEVGFSMGVYHGRASSKLTGMFTVNIQGHLDTISGFAFFDTFATAAIGARTKAGYFTADLFGIGLCINRSNGDALTYTGNKISLKDSMGGKPVNLGLLLVLPGGFQYHGAGIMGITLGLRFMFNMKLHDGVAKAAANAGVHSYENVLWKFSIRASFTVGFNFMTFFN